MKKLLSLFAIAFFCFTACDEAGTELSDSDFLIFGRYAGFCQGDCFSVFKVNSTNLVEDEISERFTGNDFEFKPGRTLDSHEYTLAQALLTAIPPELISSNIEVYGCPDCADQGGFYISFSYQGVKKSFRLDTRQTDDQSQEILTFKYQLNTLIEEIR